MLGAAAVQDTATLVRSGSESCSTRSRQLTEAAEGLAAGLRFDYTRPREKPAGDWRDKASWEVLLAEVARDAERALRAVEGDDELGRRGGEAAA